MPCPLKVLIEIVFIDGSKSQQFKKLTNHVKASNPELLICHSLRATVFCRFIKSLLRSKYVIVTTLHQLLSMSAPIQRVRRVFYSQFTDVLFAYSVAVKKAAYSSKNRQSTYCSPKSFCY